MTTPKDPVYLESLYVWSKMHLRDAYELACAVAAIQDLINEGYPLKISGRITEEQRAQRETLLKVSLAATNAKLETVLQESFNEFLRYQERKAAGQSVMAQPVLWNPPPVGEQSSPPSDREKGGEEGQPVHP